MAAEASKSSSSADTYLGSLISLTSKSEIRYEGVLYSINPEESSIGLRNVRSFGSEGRKKDGPQIPPSDKVYEFILFRGTDIKDLQVKSSPPAQTTSSIDNDPAIIQSHYPQPSATPTTPTSLAAAVSVSPTDVNSSSGPQMRHPGANIPGGPIYQQPGASLGPWGPSPPAPTVNGNPLPMPMYWPGMYVPPNGLPHLHQQTLLQQPSALSVPPPLQQPMQFSGFSAPPPNVPNSNFNLHTTSSSGPNFLSFNPSPPPPVGALMNVSTATSPFVATTSSSAVPTANSILPLNMSLPASEPPSSSVIHKGSNTPLLPSTSTALNVNLAAPLMPLPISNSEASSVNPPPPVVPRKVNAAAPTPTTSSLPYPKPTTSIVGSTEVPIPSLVTPDQLLPSAQSKTSSEISKTAPKHIEAAQVSSSSKQSEPVLKDKESRPPILPLPSAPRIHNNKSNGGHHPRHNYRGRGSGGVTRFTEDFDFSAMNEKFNKDQVWGELGKKGKEGDENGDDNYEDEDGVELPNIQVKSVYNKDDFFDSLSSNTVNNNTSHNGRPRFSEQLKLDTETFGESARYRGGGGGRGFGRGGGRASSNNGNGRGGYGYGYGGGGYGYGRGGGGGYGGRGRGRERGRGRGRGRPLSTQAQASAS